MDRSNHFTLIMCLLPTRLKVALPLFVLALSGTAAAQEVLDRATLDSILDGNQTLEGFESYSVAAGSVDSITGGPFLIDSLSLLNNQGPGLVAAGASYMSGTNGVAWLGDGFQGTATKNINLRGSENQRITYSPPVQAMGLDFLTAPGNFHTQQLDVFDTNGVLLGSLARTETGAQGERFFVGWQHAAGIGYVELSRSVSFFGTIIDDHTFGQLAPPPVLADECSGIPLTLSYSGNQSLAIDTNLCFDTMAPATTSVLQSGSCPDANNDGWIVWQPTVTGMVSMSLCGAANFDTILAVYRESTSSFCSGQMLACNDDTPGCAGNTSELQFMAEISRSYLVQVGAFSPSRRGAGTLTITELDAAPANDECSGAIPLSSASSVSYNSSGATTSAPAWSCADGGSDLWYSYTAAGNSDITVSLCTSSYDTALEIFSGTCGSLTLVDCNDDFCGPGLARQSQITFSPSDGVNYLIRVGGFFGSAGAGQITLTQDGPLGTNYCMANPNSTMGTSSISAEGSGIAADNDLTLVASDLPQNSFGFFVVSRNQGFAANPGGSSGNICLGANIGRYVGQNQIQNSGTGGTFSLTLDLSNIPLSNGAVSAGAGDTFNFQAWHRDFGVGAAASNLSDGLEINFQ